MGVNIWGKGISGENFRKEGWLVLWRNSLGGRTTIWTTIPDASESVELLRCACLSDCLSTICKYAQESLFYTQLCGCEGIWRASESNDSIRGTEYWKYYSMIFVAADEKFLRLRSCSKHTLPFLLWSANKSKIRLLFLQIFTFRNRFLSLKRDRR